MKLFWTEQFVSYFRRTYGTKWLCVFGRSRCRWSLPGQLPKLFLRPQDHIFIDIYRDSKLVINGTGKVFKWCLYGESINSLVRSCFFNLGDHFQRCALSNACLHSWTLSSLYNVQIIQVFLLDTYCQTKKKERLCFQSCSFKLWNALPLHLRSVDCIETLVWIKRKHILLHLE